MLLTQTDRAVFLSLVAQSIIPPCLKSYSDTLLFFYLGYMASSHPGSFLEIGVGGSSYPLIEISKLTQKRLHLVDTDNHSLERITDCSMLDSNLVTAWCMPSDKLCSKNIDDLVYCHIDGSKNQVVAKSDLEFCLKHLAPMGLICQDDYGNNKWPTVTALIHDMIQQKLAQIVLIGDSSIWITRPEFHHGWMQCIKQDAEMTLLAHFVNMCSARDILETNEDYYFLNAMTTEHVYFDNRECLDYFDRLLSNHQGNYLDMPYPDQSDPGYFMAMAHQSPPYTLSQQQVWDNLKGLNWPPLAPQSRQHIDNLPENIKHEIAQHHKIDLYSIDPFHAVFDHKKTKHHIGDGS